MIELTNEQRAELDRYLDAGLESGGGNWAAPCFMEALSLSVAGKFSDQLECASAFGNSLYVGINDWGWSSRTARSAAFRRMGLGPLGEKGQDRQIFFSEIILGICNRVLPPMLSNLWLKNEALVCQKAATIMDVYAATRSAMKLVPATQGFHAFTALCHINAASEANAAPGSENATRLCRSILNADIDLNGCGDATLSLGVDIIIAAHQAELAAAT